MKKNKFFCCLAAFACVCFAACENPIMKKWWEEPKPKEPEIEYVPITKTIPQVTYETIYDTIIEYRTIYETIVEQLPPKVIYESVIEYQTIIEEMPVYIYETVIEQVPEYIYETVIEKEVEYQTIYETIIEQIPEYIYTTVIEYETVTEYQTVYETIMEEVPVYIYETVMEKIPEYIYETIIEKEVEYRTIYETVYETIYDTVYNTVYETVAREPAEDEIKEYIKDHLTVTEIIEIIKNDPEFKEIIKEYIIENPSEIIQIIKDDPEFRDIVIEYIRTHITEVIRIIKDDPCCQEIIREIIQSIPPAEIVQYLTDEQIKYIIQRQPPQIILQTITIINIEYIIFAGDANIYNGNSPTGGTNLTSQEKNSNDATVNDMAQALKVNPDYLIMLHGHANPINFTAGETMELKELSEKRAKAVETALRGKFMALNGSGIADDRVSVSGYGGGKNLFGPNSTYAGLNRRVEMILIRVGIEGGT